MGKYGFDENQVVKTVITKVDKDGFHREETYNGDAGGGSQVDPEAIAQAVSNWIDEHPEVVTTVTDGSISYTKLSAEMKGKIDDVDNHSQEIASIQSALEDAVDPDDFAQLQTDVNGKIDEPQTEGTAGQVLTTDGNGGRTWTTVQGGSSVDIDATLTQQGEAADAKAAGDAIATKLAKPVTDGTNGQVLTTDGNGGVAWTTVQGGGGSSVEIDDTLTQQGEAADAKAVGDALAEKVNVETGKGLSTNDFTDSDKLALASYTEYGDTLRTEFDSSDTTVYLRRKGYIDADGKLKTSSSSPYSYYYIPALLSLDRTMIVEGNATEETYIAFVTSIVTTNNGAISFAEGETGRRVIEPGITYQFTVPDNCTFIYVYVGEDNEASAPSKIYFVKGVAQDTFENVASLVGTWETIDLESIESKRLWWGSNAYGTITNTGYTKAIPLKAGQRVRITARTDKSCNYRLMKYSPEEIGIDNQITDAGPVIYLNSTNVLLMTDEFTMPEKYKYLVIFDHQVSATTRLPEKLEIMSYTGSSESDNATSALDEAIAKDKERIKAIGLTPLPETNAEGWELPTTLQQLNVIRKCNRMRFLNWTPKRDIPSRGTGGISPGGTMFPAGVPYSSNWQDYKYPGITMSIYTFLTLVNNPYSLIYTESLKSSAPKSAWGRKWIVTNGSTYCGTVCIAFTAAVSASELVWNNPQIADVREFTVIDHVENLDPNIIKIGDIFNDNMHGVIVYAIKRDANGNITDIKLGQSSGTSTGCHVTTDTIEHRLQDYASRQNGGMYLYKYNNLYKNTDFVPEPSDIAEIDQILSNDSVVTYPTVTYQNEICTFGGDKACFALGEVGKNLIVINYNLDGESMGSYDRVRLYNTSDTTTPIGEWTIAQANATLTGVWDRDNSFSTDDYTTVDMENHAVVVSTSASPLAAGKYYAVLSDGTTDSTNKTEFEVIDNSVAVVEDNDDYYKFTLQDNIVACYLGTLSENNGDPAFSGSIKHELTHEEEVNKYLLVNKSDLAEVATNDLYIRLHTKGDYGTACVVKKVFN